MLPLPQRLRCCFSMARHCVGDFCVAHCFFGFVLVLGFGDEVQVDRAGVAFWNSLDVKRT